MYLFLEAALGWAMGAAPSFSNRRLRIGCTAAALLPELDLLVRWSGHPSWGRFQFAVTHGGLLGLLLLALAAWSFRGESDRDWLGSVLLVLGSFVLHLAVDLVLAGNGLVLFWPLSPRAFRISCALGSGSVAHPSALIVGFALPVVVLLWRKVTPLEMLSPEFDDLLMSAFRPKKHSCSECGRKCSHRCRSCTRPVCFRHATLGAHLRFTCPACIRRKAAGPLPAGLQGYLARELSFVRSKEAFRLDPEFAAFLDRKLSDGLSRLNDVPRTHPLWEGSNHEPTLAKLADLCKTLLQETPDDDEARWILFADQIRSGSADVGYSAIEPLLLRDLASIRWLVSAAQWSYRVSGLDPVMALRGPFGRLGKTVGSVETCFQELAQDANPRTRDAAQKCLEIYHGKNPFKHAAPVAAGAKDPPSTKVPGLL